MGYRHNVKMLYLIIFFHHLIPAYVIERLFWQERGMTVMKVVLCEIVYAITIVICEIPTGVLADKYGRKPLLVFGAFLSILEMVILLLAHSFWIFALAIMLAGIAGACVSGAFHALLYDSLLARNKEKDFEKIIGRMNSLDLIAAIIAALSGSVWAKWYGFEFNYILSSVSMFVALVFTILLKEPPLQHPRREGLTNKPKFKDYMLESFLFFKNDLSLVTVLIQATAIAACLTYLDEFWQLYLNEVGLTILFFGLFSSIISLARIPGNLLASWLLSKMKVKTIILFVLLSSMIGYFLTAIFPGIIGIVVILFVFFASGVVDPVIRGYVHHKADSSIRATIDSFQSLVERGITFGVGLGFGFVATKLSVIMGFAFLGLVTSLFFFWMLVKYKHIEG